MTHAAKKNCGIVNINISANNQYKQRRGREFVAQVNDLVILSMILYEEIFSIFVIN
jgi:hypothetical protein